MLGTSSCFTQALELGELCSDVAEELHLGSKPRCSLQWDLGGGTTKEVGWRKEQVPMSGGSGAQVVHGMLLETHDGLLLT